MKLQVEKSAIIDGLQKAAAILPTKAGAISLRSLWLKAEKNQLSIMATDASIEFTGNYPAEVEEPGLVGVQGRAFVDLARQLPSEKMWLSVDKDASILQIKQGRRNYKLPIHSAEWFQEFSPLPSEEPVLMSGDILGSILDRVSFCIDDDDTREATACLCLKARENGLIDACALNGHQFARYQITNDDLCARLKNNTLLVQKKFLPDIKKWLTDEEIELYLSEKRLFLKGKMGAELLSVPRVIAEYPDYNVFMAKLAGDGVSVLTLSRREAMDALSRILVFNTEGERCVFMDLSKTELGLHAKGADIGSAREELEVGYDGEISNIAFPTKNLLEIFGHFESEHLDMLLTGPEGPCGVKGDADPDYIVIIMPMKVSEKSYYSDEDN